MILLSPEEVGVDAEVGAQEVTETVEGVIEEDESEDDGDGEEE